VTKGFGIEARTSRLNERARIVVIKHKREVLESKYRVKNSSVSF
jgi:hypothetical protein